MTDIRLLRWTDARVEELKTLWARKDCSAATIAGIMNLTRNAVLGKVHRLNLEERSPRGGEFYKPERLARPTSPKRSTVPKRPTRGSVFQSRDPKPPHRIPAPKSKPALMQVVSPITGSFVTGRRRPFVQKEFTKNQLREMLAQAAANTASLEIVA